MDPFNFATESIFESIISFKLTTTTGITEKILLCIKQHLHHLDDQQDNLDSAALQRRPDDLALPHGAAVCSQTKHNTNETI